MHIRTSTYQNDEQMETDKQMNIKSLPLMKHYKWSYPILHLFIFHSKLSFHDTKKVPLLDQNWCFEDCRDVIMLQNSINNSLNPRSYQMKYMVMINCGNFILVSFSLCLFHICWIIQTFNWQKVFILGFQKLFFDLIFHYINVTFHLNATHN